jgi:hypothetical protein
MILFLVVLSLEMNVGTSFEVNNVRAFLCTDLSASFQCQQSLFQMLRSSLKISNTDITSVDSQASFWDFFDILSENLFQTEWYNGKVTNCSKLIASSSTIAYSQAFATEDEGDLAMFSRLLGGLLILQQRSASQPGACGAFAGSAYASYIGACHGGDAVDKANFTSLDGSVV